MIVFAAGNKIKVMDGANHIRSMVLLDGRTFWYVDGFRWIKSKQKFSTNALGHCVGEAEPVEIKEAMGA